MYVITGKQANKAGLAFHVVSPLKKFVPNIKDQLEVYCTYRCCFGKNIGIGVFYTEMSAARIQINGALLMRRVIKIGPNKTLRWVKLSSAVCLLCEIVDCWLDLFASLIFEKENEALTPREADQHFHILESCQLHLTIICLLSHTHTHTHIESQLLLALTHLMSVILRVYRPRANV